MSPDGLSVRVIEPGSVRFLDLRELWAYRDLLLFLTWRDISVRYKQTLLGFLWAILQPLLLMLIFTLFLGRLVKVPGEGAPYPVFVYLGLLPWTYFASAVERSGASLVANANLLTKVYFPRLLIPLSATFSALVDFVIAFLLLVGLMFWYGIVPSLGCLLLLPLVALTAFFAIGVGLWLSALNVRFRDVKYALPFLLQAWMFATPVVYPASLVPERWRLAFSINPMAGIVEAYRATVLGRPMDWNTLGLSSAAALIVFFLGILYFKRMERSFADIV